jgi:hypothetical protein
MNKNKPFLKWTVIAFLVVVITILHYTTVDSHTGAHHLP